MLNTKINISSGIFLKSEPFTHVNIPGEVVNYHFAKLFAYFDKVGHGAELPPID